MTRLGLLFGSVLLVASIAPAASPMKLGDRVPHLSFTDLNGELVRLEEFQGHVVLVDFWATWCPPCLEEIPILNSLYRQYRKQGFAILSVNGDEKPPARIKTFVQRHHIQYPVVVMTDEVIEAFGVFAIPSAFLIDRQGIVRKRYEGYKPKALLEQDLKSLLDSPTPDSLPRPFASR